MTAKHEVSVPLSVRLCSDKAAFEVRTQRKLVLDLLRVKQVFETCNGFKIMVYTPHLIVFKARRIECTLSKDGRMLLKQVRDESEAKRVALQIFQKVFDAASKP